MSFTNTISFGSVEIQERKIMRDGWWCHQSRRIERDAGGRVILISPWEYTGVRICLG